MVEPFSPGSKPAGIPNSNRDHQRDKQTEHQARNMIASKAVIRRTARSIRLGRRLVGCQGGGGRLARQSGASPSLPGCCDATHSNARPAPRNLCPEWRGIGFFLYCDGDRSRVA
jgi:hypothetical protein